MWKTALIILATLILASPSMARTARRGTSNTKAEVVKSQLWQKSNETVIHWNHQSMDDSSQCTTFQVQFGKQLSLNLKCHNEEIQRSYQLESQAHQSVTLKESHATITSYGYLIKKPQISRLKQTQLRVPYVQEIVHVKKNQEGNLAIYIESFKEDEFGRIVQDSLIQAHSLVPRELKVSSRQ
jgi:hypothetical protein